MRFLVDAQLPPALARVLADHGHFAEHVTDIAGGDAPDRWLWQYARENGAALVTKDEDFRDMAMLRGSPPPVIWIRVGNTRRQALLAWFEPLIERVVELIESGDGFVELR